MSHRIRGGCLDAIQKAGPIRTPRRKARPIVLGDQGEQPLAELVEDRHEEPPAEVDGSALTAEQRRVTQLLHGKSMTHEEVAKRLRMSVEQVREIEHRAAVELRRSTSNEVQPTITEEESATMNARTNGFHQPETATAATAATVASPTQGTCIHCGHALAGNYRCWNQECVNFKRGCGPKAGKPKSKGAAAQKVAGTAGHDNAGAAVVQTLPAAAATFGPAELEAMSAITRALIGLSDASRAMVFWWADKTFRD